MQYELSGHARRQAKEKGFSEDAVLRAAHQPSVTYDNGRYPGQKRHIRDGVVAVVDPERGRVVTVYSNVEKTKLRTNQTDRDAINYGRQNRMAAAPQSARPDSRSAAFHMARIASTSP